MGEGHAQRMGRHHLFEVLFPASVAFTEHGNPNTCASQHSSELSGPLEGCPIVSASEEAGDLTQGAPNASIIQVHARLVILLDVVYVTYLMGASVGREFRSLPQESDYI